jgi:hypothetical protein
LDTASPTGSLVINDGAAVTTSRQVTLKIDAKDGLSGVAEMRFAVNRTDDAGFGPWVDFATTFELTLPNYQGTNYVNLQLRDHAGNIRRWIWDSIILDTTAAASVAVVSAVATPTGASYDTTAEVTDLRSPRRSAHRAIDAEARDRSPLISLAAPQALVFGSKHDKAALVAETLDSLLASEEQVIDLLEVILTDMP